MKTLTLATTLAALATPALAGAVIWAMMPPAPRAFECQLQDTKRNGSLPEETTNSTWVLKINKDTWELVSVDGIVFKDQLKAEDKMLEPKPLTITDTSYILVSNEAVNRQDNDYTYSGVPMAINRITGEFYSQNNTSARNAKAFWSMTDTLKGHCQPSTMKARL